MQTDVTGAADSVAIRPSRRRMRSGDAAARRASRARGAMWAVVGATYVTAEEFTARRQGAPEPWLADVVIFAILPLLYVSWRVLFMRNSRLYVDATTIGFRDSLGRRHGLGRRELVTVFLCRSKRWSNGFLKRYVTLVSEDGSVVGPISVNEYEPEALDRWLAGIGREPRGSFDQVVPWQQARFGPWS